MPNLTVQYREFPTNNLLTLVGSFPLTSGATLPLSAPPGLSNPPDDQWIFRFWNAGGVIDQSSSVVVGPVTSNLTATAWYQKTGGGGGPPTVVCWAYSETQDLFLSDSPISSVSGGTWSGGNDKSVQTTANTTITAKSSIGSEDFTQWMVFGGATPNGTDLEAAQGTSSLAFARYKQPEAQLPGFNWRDFLKLVAGRKFVDPRDLVSDPSPVDIFRLGRVLEELDDRLGGNIDPGELAARAGSMSDSELRAAILELEAEGKRVDGALKQLQQALKRSRG